MIKKHLTDSQRNFLMALVAHYGPEFIIDIVQDIGFAMAEDEYNQLEREGKLDEA